MDFRASPAKGMASTLAHTRHVEILWKVQALHRHDTKFSAFLNSITASNGITTNDRPGDMGGNEKEKSGLHDWNSSVQSY
jgi:hypothetical protein